MANVNIQLGYKDSAWFAANATLVLLAGQVVHLQQTGTYKIGDGTTQLQNLTFKGIAQQTELVVATVVNNTGVNLLASNYQAVKVSTAQGQRLAVDFAQANNDNNSADTIGIVRQNINNNQEGEIVILGQITEVNTTGSLQGETWADGDILYLSPTVAGRITKVKPNGLTGHMVVIGYVEYAHSQHGKIYIKIQNGYELEELHNTADVTYSTPIDADSLLIKDSTASLWKRLTWANLKTALSSLFVGKTGNETIAGNKTFTNNTIIGNASETNQRQLRIGQDTAIIDIGSLPSATNYGGIWINQTTPTTDNCVIYATSGAVTFQSPIQMYLRAQSVNIATITRSSYVFNPYTIAMSATENYVFNTSANTNQNASTNISNFRINGSIKQWASGALTTQYFNYFTSNTVAFTTASTATDVFNTFIEAPIAGTNATITNAYSLGTNGKAKFGGNIELTQTVTTETVTSDTTVTIKINGVNYKLLAKS